MMRIDLRSVPAVVLLLLGGCAERPSQEGHPATLNTSATGQMADRLTRGVVGRYEMARYNGQDLPVATLVAHGSDQPCPQAPGRLISFATVEGSVTLHQGGTAELRTTAHATCETTAGEVRDMQLPQRASGRYRMAEGGVEVTIEDQTPQVYRWYPDEGTLATPDSSTVYRRYGARMEATRGDPQKVLELILAGLSAGEEHVIPDRESTAVQPVRTPVDLRFAQLHRWSVGRFEPPVVVALQADSTLQHPIGAEGATLHVVHTGTRRTHTARVLARAAVSGSLACGGQIDGLSWVYLLDVDTTRVPAKPDSGHAPTVLAFPAPFSAPAPQETPAGVRDALGPVHRALIDQHFHRARPKFRDGDIDGLTLESFRNGMYGPGGYGELGHAAIRAFRGPNGPMYVVALHMGDDPISYGREQAAYTYLLDRTGAMVRRLEGFRSVLLVGDSNGDGIDELVTRSGGIYWDGTQWRDMGADRVPEIC